MLVWFCNECNEDTHATLTFKLHERTTHRHPQILLQKRYPWLISNVLLVHYIQRDWYHSQGNGDVGWLLACLVSASGSFWRLEKLHEAQR